MGRSFVVVVAVVLSIGTSLLKPLAVARGDVITHINGRPTDSDEGGKLFANVQPGETVSFTVQRGAERKTMTVRAEARSAPMTSLAQSSASLDKARAALTELQPRSCKDFLGFATWLPPPPGRKAPELPKRSPDASHCRYPAPPRLPRA